MSRYLWLFFLLFFLSHYHGAIADNNDIEQKTDGSFVENPPQPINSSFVGDISQSTVNDSFIGENVQKQTEGTFVGDGTINSGNTYFAGDNSDKEEQQETDAAFAGNNTFAGDNYGK